MQQPVRRSGPRARLLLPPPPPPQPPPALPPPPPASLHLPAQSPLDALGAPAAVLSGDRSRTKDGLVSVGSGSSRVSHSFSRTWKAGEGGAFPTTDKPLVLSPWVLKPSLGKEVERDGTEKEWGICSLVAAIRGDPKITKDEKRF